MSNEQFNKQFNQFVRDSIKGKKIKGFDLISDFNPPQITDVDLELEIEVEHKVNTQVNTINAKESKAESCLF